MDMGINETWGDQPFLPDPTVRYDPADATPAPLHHSRKYSPSMEIDDLTRETLDTSFHLTGT